MRVRTAEDERSKYINIQNFVKPLLDMIAQCDEARPCCKACLKAKAAREYEFSAGQTRNQALSENQRRLQGQLRTFTSLIHALRCADSNTSGRILRHLRRVDYDGTLLCDDSSSDMTRHADKVYPWEDLSQDERPQSGSRYTPLPPVSDLMAMQRIPAPDTFTSPRYPSRRITYRRLYNSDARYTLLFCYGAGLHSALITLFKPFVDQHPDLGILCVDRWAHLVPIATSSPSSVSRSGLRIFEAHRYHDRIASVFEHIPAQHSRPFCRRLPDASTRLEKPRYPSSQRHTSVPVVCRYPGIFL